MTRQQQMAQQLRDNPLQQRAVYGDVTKSGGYVAALAVRTRTGIVSGVIEFTTQDNVAMLILGVLEGLERGDVNGTVTRFLDIEKSVMASTLETADTKALAVKKREVDFNRKQARAPDLLGVE